MPKHDIFFKPGQKIREDLLIFLKESFEARYLKKLTKFGGRVQISLTAPYVDRKRQRIDLQIDSLFIDKLRGDLDFAKKELETLTKKQLEKTAELLNHPFSSKATTKELRNSILSYLSSAKKWEDIINSK
jgi:hypothetical protein